MKNVLLAIFLFACSLNGSAQMDKILMTIEDEEVTVNEFLAIYNKNNTTNVVDRKTMDEYLTLFVNFKLKVKAAEELGMDTASKFINELAGYRKQLAQPYLVDREMNDQLIQEAYQRMQQDVAAYHILVKVDENAPPKDSIVALKQLQSLSKGIKTQEDMERAVQGIQKGTDKNIIAEDLGYFTAFSMVYPFETAAYNTEVGQLSKPVRTRFGYHVVFVTDKREARGEVKVSHIMVRSNEEMDEQSKEQAKEKIDEIYERIQQGEGFATLAKEYSDDQSSARNGGKLPWFGTGRMVSSFEDAAFSLQENGDMSEPIKTNYGWHIIMRDDYRGVGEFDELKGQIKKRIERDSRGQKGRISLLKKLKDQYALSYNYKNRDAVHKVVTNAFLEGKWKSDEEKEMNDPVLTIEDNVYSNTSKQYTQADYLSYLSKNQRKLNKEMKLSDVLKNHWNDFVDESLIDFENGILEYKYPEFKALMKEYHDGILLFDLMDKKVWSKAVKDTTGLEAYYEAHKQDFMWDERVDASIYICENGKIAKKTAKMAKKRLKKGYTDSDIMEEINEDNPLHLSIRSGIYSKGESDYIHKVAWEKGMTTIDGENGKKVIVQIYDVMAPSPKALSESRGLVTSAYQSHLEKQWIEELRDEYDFEVDYKVFQAIEKE